MVYSSSFPFKGKKMTTMQQAASQAAIPAFTFTDIRQRGTHFNFDQDDVPGLKKSKHPNRHRRWYNSTTNRRGRRGSSFSRRR